MTSKKLPVGLLGALLVLGALVGTTPALAQGACIDFEAPAFVLGTQYGAPAGHVPNQWVFNYAGIDARVHKFDWGGGTTFRVAHIDNAPPTLGPTQSLRFNNINMSFDFSSWGTLPKTIKVSYVDLGGIENLSINGSAYYVGDIAGAPAVLGGVNVMVTAAAIPGGKTGTIVLRGSVKYFTIGGQEFWIDDLCATP